jgi:hypothetical protein
LSCGARSTSPRSAPTTHSWSWQPCSSLDEIRDPKAELGSIPAKTSAKPNELTMAAELIDSMTAAWRHDEGGDHA